MQTPSIPRFYLYGEPHRNVSKSFVHVESLDDRSRPSEWTIAPHSHGELCHIFLMTDGGGLMQAEDLAIEFETPCLLLIPPLIVHSFRWHAESHGSVVTMASGYFAELTRRDERAAELFHGASTIPLARGDADRISASLDTLRRELGWAAPGHRIAVDAALLAIVVVALRSAGRRIAPCRASPQEEAIVARLRERIEQRFRAREPISAYAAALGVSATVLRVACANVAGTPPALMLDQRALLEAKRSLLYSNMTIAEVSYATGFTDPAYFSRFFTRHVGLPPRAYRKRLAPEG